MEKLNKIYIAYVGLFWLLYGAAVTIKPEILSIVANLTQDHWVAAIEVRAMYGGLEFALGVFTLLGFAANSQYRRSALMLNALVLSALALVRAVGLLIDGPSGAFAMSFGATDIPMTYNAGALWCFELPGAIFAWLLLKKSA